MKVYNFSPGPAILPQEVFSEASDAVKNFMGSGLSILEISHRSPSFISIMDEAQDLVLELLGLKNKGYKALFLQGGASLQFLMTAYNLLQNKAAYINTGSWAKNAIKQAKFLGLVDVIASSEDKNFNYIPKSYTIPSDSDYCHITLNNTIFGTQYMDIPQSPIPMVADMSSDIFSREIDFSKFDLFYAGAQKNSGPAGVTLVILKENALGKVSRDIPTMLDYKTHIDKGSMYNTPPVFSIYVTLLNLRWLKAQGGIKAIEIKNKKKAELLYQEIDNNEQFNGFSVKEDRSFMNVTFTLTDESLKPKFDKLWKEAGISNLGGHRSVGGYRASIYNAMEIEGVKVLVDVMKTFNKTT